MFYCNPTILEMVAEQELNLRERAAERRRVYDEWVYSPGRVASGIGQIRNLVNGFRQSDDR
jgi:hypothetical protein